ncbi:MAG: 30S ribosomal protein S20 [Holosporales bacterium]|jgi:small subunit ribosomal protein S20|nr:30S ribosomal protein S20 [Holosporales bacterium]
MASHKSTKKSIRKTAKQTIVNGNRISRIRTFIKKVEISIKAKESKESILNAFSKMQKEIMRGVNKHVLHKNTAARKISRINKVVKTAIGENC